MRHIMRNIQLSSVVVGPIDITWVTTGGRSIDELDMNTSLLPPSPVPPKFHLPFCKV